MMIMKRLILILVAFMAFKCMAQESSLNTIFDKYSGKDGYTSIYITSYMFELLASVDDSNDPELQNAAKGIESIKMITINGETGNDKKEAFYNEVLNSLPNNVYKDFMIVKDGQQEVYFKIHEKDKVITELVMLVKDVNEPLLMFIEGKIDLKTLAKLSKSVDVKGFDQLQKVDEKK
jgi:hypothetical protein